MKITFISDTHGKHQDLRIPDTDVLVHCGDFTMRGELVEVSSFLNWFQHQPARHRILIAGNHELTLDGSRREFNEMVYCMVKNTPGITYLEQQAITIEGVHFFGSPITPEFCGWAFMNTKDRIKGNWNLIPEGTDVLITHGPPYGILDINKRAQHCGCPDLLEVVERIAPKIHSFGHIHTDKPEQAREYNNGVTHFINASNLDERYQLKWQPIVIEL
jgi:Icc-related predicted phosphoesterase